jgi:uncharacterized protein involved in response to NO
MTVQSSNGLPIRKPAFALFAYGFRPFFWLAAAFALIAIMAWLGVVSTGLLPLPGQPALIWHGHEMLYGFIGAAIAGFRSRPSRAGPAHEASLVHRLCCWFWSGSLAGWRLPWRRYCH